MRLRPYFGDLSLELSVYGIGDKILTKKGIKYMLFFESDEAYHGRPFLLPFVYAKFDTRNGFHIVGKGLWTAKDKLNWFKKWQSKYPDSDYILNNINFLNPKNDLEKEFICEQAYQDVDLVCSPMLTVYYRDKKVFENIEARKRL